MLFIANALVFASIVTRYPELKDRFDLSELTFGRWWRAAPWVPWWGARCGSAGRSPGGCTGGCDIVRASRRPAGGGRLCGRAGHSRGGFVRHRVRCDGRRRQQRPWACDSAPDGPIDHQRAAWGMECGGDRRGSARRGCAAVRGSHRVHLSVMGFIIIVGSLARSRSCACPPTPPSPVRSESHRSGRFSAILIAACAIAAIGGFLEDSAPPGAGLRRRRNRCHRGRSRDPVRRIDGSLPWADSPLTPSSTGSGRWALFASARWRPSSDCSQLSSHRRRGLSQSDSASSVSGSPR